MLDSFYTPSPRTAHTPAAASPPEPADLDNLAEPSLPAHPDRPLPDAWLALCLGNTRAHWTYLEGDCPRATWDLPHITPHDMEASIAEYLAPYLAPCCVSPTAPTRGSLTFSALPASPELPIAIASVVPDQTALWRTWLDRDSYPHRVLALDDIPLAGLYSTLGIDRALAGLGIGWRFGFPCLTIDGGTAMTFTGFAATDNGRGELVGGAIVPGMGLQYRSLGKYAAQLPHIHSHVQPVRDPQEIAERVASLTDGFASDRWALNTTNAIDSGIQRAVGALAWDFISDWWRQYPDAIVAIAGGDAIAIRAAIARHLSERDERDLTGEESQRLRVVPEAIVWGTIATLQAIGPQLAPRTQAPSAPDLDGSSL
ncbi:MAG: type III pantothenate kinase [Geitlerinemataceae cyanobacterium]|mgnify:CR=1 FL=1